MARVVAKNDMGSVWARDSCSLRRFFCLLDGHHPLRANIWGGGGGDGFVVFEPIIVDYTRGDRYGEARASGDGEFHKSNEARIDLECVCVERCVLA